MPHRRGALWSSGSVSQTASRCQAEARARFCVWPQALKEGVVETRAEVCGWVGGCISGVGKRREDDWARVHGEGNMTAKGY